MSETVKPNFYSHPDGSFHKVLITKGYGFYVPIDGSVCKVKILSDEDSLIADTDEDHVKEVIIGEADSEVDAVLHACVGTMKEDEICEIVVNSNLSPISQEKVKPKVSATVIDELKSPDDEKELSKEDDENDKNTIESAAEQKENGTDDNKNEDEKLNERELKSPVVEQVVTTHKLRLHLVSFTRQPEIWEMSVTEKWRRANHHKDCGMILFNRGVIQWAFRRFSVALKFLISAELDIPPEELGKDMDIKGMKLSCYLNLAACHLKRRNFESVVKTCTKALELDVYNTKALYRRGMAYTHVQEYEKAKEDLDNALQLEPSNAAIIKQQQLLKMRVQNLNKYFANAMRKMFA